METRPGAVAIFVKTPGLSPIKTRLAQAIGRDAAEKFHRLSARAVEGVVQSIAERCGIAAYWAVAEDEALSHPLWRNFATVPQGPGSLGERLSRVYDLLIERHRFVLFLGADSPQVTAAILRSAVEALSRSTRQTFVLGRSRDGGFYLFGGTGPLPQELWYEIPYSQSFTAQELMGRLSRLGPVAELPMLCDVDTADDLPQLLQDLHSLPAPMPEQTCVSQWVEGLVRGGRGTM